MTLTDFFHTIRKHKILLLAMWLILLTLSLPFIAQNQKERFKTYIFFTVAPEEHTFKEEPAPSINSFYLISASDLFAETIIGWFKNPSFLQDIETNSFSPLPSLYTRKETKQNVMIFYTTEEQEQGERLSSAIIDRIQQSIDAYNTATNTKYSLTNLSSTMMPLSPSLLVDGMIGLIVTFCISLILLFLFFPPLRKKTTQP